MYDSGARVSAFIGRLCRWTRPAAPLLTFICEHDRFSHEVSLTRCVMWSPAQRSGSADRDAAQVTRRQQPPRRIAFGFVLQQVLGWVGGTQALKRFVEADQSVAATWNEVTFVRRVAGRAAADLTRRAWRDSWRAADTTRTGRAPPAGDHGGRRALRCAALQHAESLSRRAGPHQLMPSVLVTDVTPRQLVEMEATTASLVVAGGL